VQESLGVMNQKLNFDLVAVVGAHKRGVYLSSPVYDGIARQFVSWSEEGVASSRAP